MNNAELEELLKQRRELDKKINAIRSQERRVEGAVLCQRYGDAWAVTLKETDEHSYINKAPRYKQIVITKTREACIEALKEKIDILTELYNKVTED